MTKLWQSVDEYVPLSEVHSFIPLRHVLNAWRWAWTDPPRPPNLSETITPALNGILGNLALVAVDREQEAARYLKVGRNLTRLLGEDPTGKLLHEVYSAAIATEVCAALAKVARCGQPTYYRREFTIMGKSFGYLRLILPVRRIDPGDFALVALYPSSAQFIEAAQWQSQLEEAEKNGVEVGVREPVWI